MNHQTENDNTNGCLRALKPVADFLKDKKLEGLGIASYAGGKIIFWSFPSIKEICLVVMFVLVVRISKKIFKLIAKCSFVEILREWGHNIDSAFEDFCKRWFSPVFEPHEFIQWLTAGKFDVNIACEEKKPFFKPQMKKCRHKRGCHFTHERRHMPKVIRMNRLAAIFVGKIYISEFLNTIKRRELSSSGYFLAYDVFGITFRIAEEHWANVLEEYSSKKKRQSHTIVEMVAHIVRFGGRIRLRIEARQVRNEAGMVIIRGKYVNMFTPANIQPHPKGRLSIPICDIWQQQYKPPLKQIYTPIHPIP